MYMYPVNENGEYSLFYMLQSFVYNTADEANMESMDLVGRIEDRSEFSHFEIMFYSTLNKS